MSAHLAAATDQDLHEKDSEGGPDSEQLRDCFPWSG